MVWHRLVSREVSDNRFGPRKLIWPTIDKLWAEVEVAILIGTVLDTRYSQHHLRAKTTGENIVFSELLRSSLGNISYEYSHGGRVLCLVDSWRIQRSYHWISHQMKLLNTFYKKAHWRSKSPSNSLLKKARYPRGKLNLWNSMTEAACWLWAPMRHNLWFMKKLLKENLQETGTLAWARAKKSTYD